MYLFFLYLFFLYFFIFIGSDFLLQKYTSIRGIYYLFHFIHNMIIMFLTYRNLLSSFYPKNLPYGELNPNVLPLIYSLHTYHIFSYSNYFRKDDWLHHLFSMGIAVPITLYSFPSRHLLGFSFFFTTGLPGGMNYLLLFLYKNKLLEKSKQQYYNTILNSWIRCPGIIMNCAFILQYLCLYTNTFFEKFIGLFPFFILFWNGVYFQNIVLESFFTRFK